jgi:hypothetical protein
MSNTESIGLIQARRVLAVIQGCLALYLQGERRPSATEIAELVFQVFKIRFYPAEIGNILRRIGIDTKYNGGKIRFVMNKNQLESLQTEYQTFIKDIENKLRSILEANQGINQRVAELQQEYVNLSKSRIRYRELTDKIKQLRPLIEELPFLEQEVARLETESKRYDELKSRQNNFSARFYGRG